MALIIQVDLGYDQCTQYTAPAKVLYVTVCYVILCHMYARKSNPKLCGLSAFWATFRITGDHFGLQMRNGNWATFGLLFASVWRRDFRKIWRNPAHELV